MYFRTISQPLANLLYNESIELQSKPIWYSSLLNWPEYLTSGIDGTVLATMITDSPLRDRVIEELELDGSKVLFQHYIWLPYSGIRAHTDDHVEQGITIYLTEHHWSEGAKLHFEQDGQEFNITPEVGKVVINDKHTKHWVNPINAGVIRRTVQLWVTK